MDLFTRLFGSLLAFVYHCFDRIVILAYLPLLTRPENVVHFFHDVQRIHPITKEALRKRTDEYHAWVEAYAKKNNIAMEWAERGIRKSLVRRIVTRSLEYAWAPSIIPLSASSSRRAVCRSGSIVYRTVASSVCSP